MKRRMRDGSRHTHLLYYVAQVCCQEDVDIAQSVIDIWELTNTENKGQAWNTCVLSFILIPISRVGRSLVLCYPGEVRVGSQLGQRGADGVTGVRHSSVGASRVRQRVGQRGPLL